MADTQAVPPLPERGEIVTEKQLYTTQIAQYRDMLAFSGAKNPTMVWSSMVREDSSAILYYRELEEKDPDVANALDTLKGDVIERSRSVSPGDGSQLGQDVADFINQQLDGISNFDGMLDSLLDAPGYGFSVQEMIFDTSMGQASLLDIKDCPQELFLFGNRFTPQIGALQFLDSPYASSGQLVPEEKFLVYSYRMRARSRMGRPLLRSIFWSSWIKRNILTLWMRYAEKGPGTAVVRYQDAASEADRINAANIALSLINEPAISVPANFLYDAELLKGSRTIDPAVYEHLFEAMQLDIVRRILGETQTSFGGEKGKGTQALGEVHSDTLEKKVISICKSAASVINRQLIRPLVLWNFGPQAPMPKFAWQVDQEEDLDKQLNRDKILIALGLPYSVAYLQQKYEIPAPAEGDVLLKPAPAAGTVPADPDAEDVTFASAEAKRAAHAELDQFDALMDELRTDAAGLMKDRVHQVASAITHAGGGPR